MSGRVLFGVVATLTLLVAGQIAALDHGPRTVAPAPTVAPAAVSAMPVAPSTTLPAPVVAPAASTTLPVPVVAPAVASAVAVPVAPRITVVAVTTATVVPSFVAAPAQGFGLPSWRVTDDGVPYFSGRPACTVGQASLIAAGFADAGASQETRWWAIYVASRESGCDHTAVNINRATRDRSVCLHQLNGHAGGPLAPGGVLAELGWTVETAPVSFESCVLAAAQLWAVCGRGPWTKNDYSCRRPTS